MRNMKEPRDIIACMIVMIAIIIMCAFMLFYLAIACNEK